MPLDHFQQLHDFSSAAHLHMTVKKIRSLTLDFNTHGRTIRGNPDGLFFGTLL
jgi:hypothetical protein